MHVISCDIVVVGAGPAGSSTARSAADHGAQVVFLEEHPEVGVPVSCAEGLSANGLKTAGLRATPDVVSQDISRVRIFAPAGKYLEIPPSARMGFTINRDVFDRKLADVAVEHGAELMLETRATRVIREGDWVKGVYAERKGEPLEIRAGIVVGAEGFTSIVRRTAGMGRWYGDVAICAQYRLGNLDLEEPDVDEFYIGSNVAPGGYAWVFPKSRNVANVGLGVRLIHSRPALEYLKDFVSRDPRLRDAKVLLVNGGVTPASGLIEPMTGNGVMLVGEAAGQLIAVTGAGVHAGVAGGLIAGKVGAKAVQRGDVTYDALREYEEQFGVEWGKRIKMSRKVVEMLDKLNDADSNALANVVDENDVLDLANGQNTSRVLGKLLRRAPAKIMKLALAYLST